MNRIRHALYLAAVPALLLVACAGDPPVLDVVHLGLGADGHTASLVPGDPVLEESRRWVGVSRRYANYRRLTLTLPALWSAEVVVVAALGQAKAAVLKDALEYPDSPLPVALAIRGARRAVMLLDPAAAARLAP